MRNLRTVQEHDLDRVIEIEAPLLAHGTGRRTARRVGQGRIKVRGRARSQRAWKDRARPSWREEGGRGE
jgi:hypothetical protein